MKKTKLLVLIGMTTFLGVSCKKEKVNELSITSDKTIIYPIYEESYITVNGGENATTIERNDGDGFQVLTGDNRFLSDKVGVYTITARAMSKKGKVLAESNTIDITVEKFNKYIVGTYDVKDTCWDYSTNSLTSRQYIVTITDDGSENGDGVWIKNYGDIYHYDSVHYEITPYANNEIGTYSSEVKKPFSQNSNISYQISLIGIPYHTKLDTFKSYGNIFDETIQYQSGETTPYFRGFSTWTRIE